MAGSIADFKYTDDNGKSWLVRIDKSNALTTGTGFAALTQADMSLEYLPRNIEMRFVTCRHPTRPINRRIYCANTDAAIWKGTQKTIQLEDHQDRTMQAFNIGKRTAENRKYQPNLTDTYQTDSP
jgi:hypothetical protein